MTPYKQTRALKSRDGDCFVASEENRAAISAAEWFPRGPSVLICTKGTSACGEKSVWRQQNRSTLHRVLRTTCFPKERGRKTVQIVKKTPVVKYYSSEVCAISSA